MTRKTRMRAMERFLHVPTINYFILFNMYLYIFLKGYEDGNEEYEGEGNFEQQDEEFVNEDSMDVGMMQQPSADANIYSSFSNQGIF